MLTAVETQDVYNELVNILQELGLNWLVGQVEEHIAYGRYQTDISVKAFRSQRDEQGKGYAVEPTKATTNNLTGAEEYTENERLLILIQAIRTVAKDSLEVEGAVIQYFTESGKPLGVRQPDSITFRDGAQGDGFTINPEGHRARQDSLQALLPLLDELIRESS